MNDWTKGNKDRKLEMRPFHPSDSALLLSWRNHDLVRLYSRNSAPISIQEHKEWLEKKVMLSDASCRIYIFTENEIPVGMTRIDQLDNSSVEISILVDPKQVSRGFGSAMMKKTLLESFLNRENKVYLATIHNQNLASIALFEKFGFLKTQTGLEFSTYCLSNLPR